MFTSTTGIFLVALFALFALASPIQPGTVVIPSADTTPPSVVLTTQFIEPGKPAVSVTAATGDITANISGNEEVTLTATCTDNDGGCKDIQIQVDRKTITVNPNGSTTVSPGGLTTAPTVSNPDQSAQRPGDRAQTERTTTYKLRVNLPVGGPTKYKYEIYAAAQNFHGGRTVSRLLTLNAPHNKMRVATDPYPLAGRLSIVTVYATDSITGKPVAGKVVIAGRIVANTGAPFIYTFRPVRRRTGPEGNEWEWIYPEAIVTSPGYQSIPVDFGLN